MRDAARKVLADQTLKEEILKFCRLNLSPFKCPRMVEFRDDLPKTSTGKISRGALRRMEKS